MTNIHQTIKSSIIDAMRAKDAIKLDVLRGLAALFTNELIVKGGEFLPDEDALNIIRRSVKQHKDSIEQFTKGGRIDLVEKEKAELVILEAYLPAMMSKDDIQKAAEAKLAGAPLEKAKMGQLMGMLMKDLKGKADGADVKEVLESIAK